MTSADDLVTMAVIIGLGLISLVVAIMMIRASTLDRDGGKSAQARRRARWGVAALSGLLAVGAAGIAFMRTVTL